MAKKAAANLAESKGFECPRSVSSVLCCALFSILICSSQALANVGEYHSPWDDKRADNNVNIGIWGKHYINKGHNNREQVADVRADKSNISIGGRTAAVGDTFEGAAEAQFGFERHGQAFKDINVPELYVGSSSKNPFHVDLGRKLETWNRFEDFWALGLFQPRYRWDYLDVRTNGLTGLFLHYDTKLVQAMGFWTPLWIPERGAPFDMSGGKCSTGTPWFACPGSTVNLFNQPTDIYYKLDIPNIAKFINRPGFGGSLRVGEKQGPWIQASGAHKAMNQYMLAYEGYLSLSTETLPATIHVRANDHEIYSLESGYTTEAWSLMMSGIKERPIRDITPANWTTEEESNSTYFGPTLYTRLFGKDEGATNLDVGYLKRSGGNPSETGPFANPDAPVFEPRHSYAEAFSLNIRTPFKESWGKYFWCSSRFVLDTPNRGNILITDVNFKPTHALLLNFGIDLLGSDSAKVVDFISRYQRNDRIRGGLKYVF